MRILHKRNITADTVPTTASLTVGELAINVADGKLFGRRSGSVGDYIVSYFGSDIINTGSYIISGSLIVSGSMIGTASYAITASYALNGGGVVSTSIKTTAYTVTTSDYIIVGNHPSTPFTITLIAASSNAGRNYIIKNKGAAIVTVDATGLGQIDGTDTYTLDQYQSLTLASDGSTWNII